MLNGVPVWTLWLSAFLAIVDGLLFLSSGVAFAVGAALVAFPLLVFIDLLCFYGTGRAA